MLSSFTEWFTLSFINIFIDKITSCISLKNTVANENSLKSLSFPFLLHNLTHLI